MLAGGDHRSRDWTALPGELLACIRGRLPPADFARFPAVCTAWRRAAPSTPAPQLPWLLVPPFPTPSSSSPRDGVTCRFFSPSEGKTYRVPVPELRGARCVGSCEGWAASFDRAKAEMSLVNPFTRARIPLPSLLTAMPELTGIDELHPRPRKVVMSSAPTDPACALAAALDCFFPMVFVLVGGEKWAVAPVEAGELADMVYHDGDGKFYGVDVYNSVFRWHTAGVDLLELCCQPAPDFPRPWHRYNRHLAVHRPSGDLLLIFVDFLLTMQIFRDAPNGRVQTAEAVMAFRYRGDGVSAGAWLQLESLGGCSLFLGRNGNQPICLSAQDVPQLRADCIFFIGQNPEWDDMGPCWSYGLCIYDLKEGVLEPYCPHWRNRYHAPLWFAPNLS